MKPQTIILATTYARVCDYCERSNIPYLDKHEQPRVIYLRGPQDIYKLQGVQYAHIDLHRVDDVGPEVEAYIRTRFVAEGE